MLGSVFFLPKCESPMRSRARRFLSSVGRTLTTLSGERFSIVVVQWQVLCRGCGPNLVKNEGNMGTGVSREIISVSTAHQSGLHRHCGSNGLHHR